MRFLLQGETNDTTNPVLELWTQQGGILKDVASLEVQIFNLDSGSPVQVIPGSGRLTVDLVNDKISTGRYAPDFTLDGAEPVGLHSIKWFLKFAATDPEEVFDFEFDVLETGTIKPLGQRCYALLSEVRAEDLPITQADDNRVLRSIGLASQQIEQFTNRFFGVVGKTLKINGRGSPDLLIREPIVGLTGIQILSHAFGAETSIVETDLEDVGIYNRHLAQNLFEPDDRENPKISFFRLDDHLGNFFEETRPLFPHHIFPFGQQNVSISGAFGYTEPNGSPMGDVPRLIRRACILLVNRIVNPALGLSGGSSVPAGPIIEERTRDQLVRYAVPKTLGGAGPGPFTGDPEIDNILLAFARGPALGAA